MENLSNSIREAFSIDNWLSNSNCKKLAHISDLSFDNNILLFTNEKSSQLISILIFFMPLVGL